MANLDGSRSHGAVWDQVAGGRLRRHPQLFAHVYRTLLTAARAEGFTQEQLPDFLGLEPGGELVLLGQDELEWSAVEADIERRLRRWRDHEADEPAPETERILLGAIRVGQHVFASRVLANCGRRCVFCGLTPPEGKTGRLLVASHIKPWRHSAPRERRDHRNGLAACPTHDAAFDTGLLTVNGGLRIHRAPQLLAALDRDDITRLYFAQPPLQATILLPRAADPPGEPYLRWHREQIFAA
jgi:putative restriction endonuclease